MINICEYNRSNYFIEKGDLDMYYSYYYGGLRASA